MENKEINVNPEIAAEEGVNTEAVSEEITTESAEAVETVIEETPVEEVPAEEAPIEEAPAEEEPVEEAPAEEEPAEEPIVDKVDKQSVQVAAEETEAEKITVAPIGEAPEIKVKEPSAVKKAAGFFTSVRWQRTWDKISVWLLVLLFALPIAALVYLLTYFF